MKEVDDVLEHFGVLGMHWGKRGSKKIGGKIHSTIKKHTAKENPSEDHTKKVTLKKKKLHQMSNEELRTLNTRMQLERQYKDLNKHDVSAGRAFVTKTLTDIGSDIIKTTMATAIKKAIKI